MTSRNDRMRGALLGLAAGDALGAQVEFMRPGSFPPVTAMVGGGPHRLGPGEWTDDTSMALCLAESLLERRGHDPVDQLERYRRWWRDGHLSVTGTCFDIGLQVTEALRRFEATGEPHPGPTDDARSGNGSLMRLAPVPMFWFGDRDRAVAMAAESSRTTHGSAQCLDACRYYAGLVHDALAGLPKRHLLRDAGEGLHPLVAAVAAGSYKDREPPAIQGTGWVVRSLEAALWAFYRSDDFGAGARLAANLGDDADTTAAIYGQLAGACYGVDGIPADWRAKLAWHDRLLTIADRLDAEGPGVGDAGA